MNVILREWGWDEGREKAFNEHISQHGLSEALPARVVGEEKGFLRIICQNSEIKWARFKKKEEEIPAVGDWIVGTPMAGTDRMLFESLLPRRTWLRRREAGGDLNSQIIGANVDRVFIVSSLNSDFNPKRIERYLALAYDGFVEPIVLLSKSDLVKDVQSFVNEVRNLRARVEILPVSIFTGDGLSRLEELLESGSTVGFLGSSGVGKSSLVNYFLREDRQKTMDLRSDDKGRHTTTSRMIFKLPDKNCCLLDTPGMREVGLWIEGEGIERLYAEIHERSTQCKFRDCEHINEPSCAVRQAVEKNEISSERYESYLKLRGEAQFSVRKSNKALESAHRKAWKRITKSLRLRNKSKRPD